MRTIVIILTAATFCAAAWVVVNAADEELALKGELIEVSCYSKLGVEKSTGPAHASCAKDCAAKGLALGVLTDGDGLVKITGAFTENKNAKLLPFVGKKVDVRGNRDRYLDYSAAINVKTISLSR